MIAMLKEPLALVGMSCRFPGGANDVRSYWELITKGENTTRPIPRERWDWRRFHDRDGSGPGKSIARAGSFITQPIDRFDAGFFGISPREAAPLDPQQRLLLEVAWEAVEGAGLVMESLHGAPVGVYVGAFGVDNQLMQMSRGGRFHAGSYTIAGCSTAMLANRISYTFGFTGPSLTMDTACSSSLVAFHYACQGLWDGECELAIAGGVNLMFHPDFAIGLSKARFLAPDGRCKSFDRGANGYGRGEGAGVVVLKRLSRALEDGDPIHALVRGTGVNQDGQTPGITVPSGAAQARLMRTVCERAGIDAGSIGYLEAHGTGTPVGDPIEAGAIGEAVGVGRGHREPCFLGSVKANIGHLEAAAGIAGVIKAALCLKHRSIPPHPLVEGPNPKIPFGDLGLRLSGSLSAWPRAFDRAIAGVNSFGFGGANAHAILEEPPPSIRRNACRSHRQPSPPRPHLLTLSARSQPALQELVRSHVSLARGAEPFLPDLCYTAAVRSSHLSHRVSVVVDSPAMIVEKLTAFADGTNLEGVQAGVATGRHAGPVLVYSGMGPQWWGMGRRLLTEEPVFRGMVETIDAIFQPIAGWSLIREIEADEASSRVGLTEVAQPLNFAIQAGLTTLLRSWGVVPAAIVGHSVGEVTAAWASGMLDLADATRVSFHRGRLQAQTRGGGGMLAVGLPADSALARLNGRSRAVVVGAINSPFSCTLSGEPATLRAFAGELEAERIFHRFLNVDIAYHSPQMEGLEPDLKRSLAGITPLTPNVPLYSTVTGARVETERWGPDYWFRNVREPVLFAAAIHAIAADGHDLFLEVGPHPVLASSIVESTRQSERPITVHGTLHRKKPERASLLDAIGGLHAAGCGIDWRGLFPERGEQVELPSYPWQRERHWCESLESREDRQGGDGHPLLDLSLRGPDPAWRADLDHARFPYLVDHQIQGNVVFPGAGYVEACLAAAIEFEGAAAGPIVLEDIAFTKALMVSSAGETRLSVTLDPRERRVSVHACLRGAESAWDSHATARIMERKGTQPTPRATRLDDLRTTHPTLLEVAASYDRLAARGLEYGPCFQAISSLAAGSGSTLAELVLPARLEDDLERYHLHPVLLDAAFQALLAGTDPAVDPERDWTLFLPIGIDRLRFHSPLPGRLWCAGSIVKTSPAELVANLILIDESGNTLAEIQGFRCQALAQPAATDDLASRWRHELAWRPAPPLETTLPVGRALVLADSGGLGHALARRLSERGDDPILVERGLVSTCVSSSHYTVAAGDLDWLIKRIGPDSEPPRTIVFAWGLDIEPPTTGPLSDQQSGLVACVSLVQLIQAIGRGGWSKAPRLWILTQGAERTDDADSTPAPTQAALWGQARVIEVEHPELRASIVDFDHGDREFIDRLIAEIAADGPESEVAYRAGARRVSRVVRSTPERERPSRMAHGDEAYELELTAAGSFDNLQFRECARIAPGPGEVEVQIAASGLNYKDVLKVMGVLSDTVTRDTWSGRTLGLECSGVIVRVGPGVSPEMVGREVQGWTAGGFRRYLTAPQEQFAPRFAGHSLAQAAAAPVVFLTAYYGLKEIARLEPGETVLIHAASGGVGLAAIQIAHAMKAKVLATAGSQEKRDYLRSLGVEHVMDSRSLDFVDEILAITGGKGVDVILNSLTGDALRKSIDICASHGRFIEIGKRDIDQDSALHMRPFNRGLLFAAIDLDRLLIDRPATAARLQRELAELFDRGELSPIPITTYPASLIDEAFRLLAQAKHIGKVVVTHGETVPVVGTGSGRGVIRGDGTYLVTGGLSGFGLETARWLADQGAGGLVLLGRRGVATQEARDAVAELEGRGVAVKATAVDVTDHEATERLLAEIARTMPPLKGVFHAAMVLDDDLLDRLDEIRYRRALDPKVKGAWNLHVLTRHVELDHFVLFSSMVAVIGNLGQSSYAAANACLDALASHRRGLGLPALSVNWGSLAEAGFVARNQAIADHLERTGLVGIPARSALGELERLLAAGRDRAITARIDWSVWKLSAPTVAARPKYQELLESVEQGGSTESGPEALAAILRASAADDRLALAAQVVQEIVAKVLRLPAEKLDVHQNITQLGIDSLMAVELQSLIAARTGASFSPMDFMAGPSVATMAARLLEKLAIEVGDSVNANPAAPEPVSDPNGHLGTHEHPSEIVGDPGVPDIDHLSDAEVDALLDHLMNQEAHS